MISPHTPPGTRVVISWLAVTPEDYLSVVAPEHRAMAKKHLPNTKQRYDLGMTFVLDFIEPEDICEPPFVAGLIGESGILPLKCLSLAPLPKVLTDILISVPIHENA